jgi:hypothetical protein
MTAGLIHKLGNPSVNYSAGCSHEDARRAKYQNAGIVYRDCNRCFYHYHGGSYRLPGLTPYAVPIPIEAMRIRRENPKSPIRNISTIQIRRLGWDTDTRVSWRTINPLCSRLNYYWSGSVGKEHKRLTCRCRSQLLSR